MTVKGAAVTLSSTVASCTLACYIEIGAHRIVYHYFPQKYANVEHANGLTQEQLDAVRIYKVSTTSATVEEEREQVEEIDASVVAAADAQNKEQPLLDLSTVYKAPSDEELAQLRPLSSYTIPNTFWKEETRDRESKSILPKPSFVFPSSDIMACAMTG